MIADPLADAILKQFPDKFARWTADPSFRPWTARPTGRAVPREGRGQPRSFSVGCTRKIQMSQSEWLTMSAPIGAPSAASAPQ